MSISQLGTRITDFARAALTAATRNIQIRATARSLWRNGDKLETRNQKPSSPPLASILRPQARERWLLPQVGAITPQYIEMTLRGALAGAHLPQWELFNLMEDTWPRLRKNLLELKMAVRNRRPVFEAYRDEDMEESPTATERMKLVSAALRHMQPDPTADEGGFDDMLFDILDAWFKGVSVLEIDWHVTQTQSLGRFIAPRCTRWANPIHYAWDTDLHLGLNVEQTLGSGKPETRAERQRDAHGATGANPKPETCLSPFPPDRFLVAKCKTKSGSILGGALLRPLVWWWCAANFSADWLLNLAQIFGLPFRWATYEPTAAQETVDRICAMLQNMGSAGWAAFPAGTSLELKADGQKSGAQTPQGDMLDRADKQCDLLVLGQTLTTDTGGMGSGGGSHALGQVHADVRSGIIDAAAKFTAGVLEQQLIPAILRLNYGDCEEAPTLTLQPVTADNLQEKAAILTQLHAAGAGSIIPLDWLGKTFGIPKPKAGEATLGDKAETSLPTAPFAAVNFNPNQPRAFDGRWSSTRDLLADTASNPAPTTGSRAPTGEPGTPGPTATPNPSSGVVARVATDANPKDYSDDQKKRLTEAAQRYMENAYQHHPSEMGSQHPDIRTSGKKRVHCTTYCVDAIAAGYKAIGMPKTAQKIASMRDGKGVDIAKYLKDTLGWDIVYFNSDVQNKSLNGEHLVSNIKVDKYGTYYYVEVDGKMVNYDPQLGGSERTRTVQSPDDKVAQDKMYQIPFGMISATGGMHNALFSKGNVYQIHYAEDSSTIGTPDTDTLYEKSSFLEFTREHWRSGIIAVPPGQDIPRKAP